MRRFCSRHGVALIAAVATLVTLVGLAGAAWATARPGGGIHRHEATMRPARDPAKRVLITLHDAMAARMARLSTSAGPLRRRATPSEKASIIRALENPHALCTRPHGRGTCTRALATKTPARCVVVHVSTVDPAWGAQSIASSSRCAKWRTGDGSILHRLHRRWIVFTEGSAFTSCPIRGYDGRGTMPRRASRDLLGFC